MLVSIRNGATPGIQQTVRLGRIPPAKIDDLGNFLLIHHRDGTRKLVPKLSAHMNAQRMAASVPPASLDYATKAMASISRMYLNDTYSNCVIASKYHGVGVWSANDTTQGNPPPVVGSDSEVLSMYHTICGRGDNGCVITQVLDYFKKTGLLFNGVRHKIDGYVAVDWTNKVEVQTAILVFGGLTLGINLPNDWTCTNCTWDTTNSSIVGGHDVRAIDYNEHGVRIATWAGVVTITWPAFLSKKWLEECYVELSPDWYGSDKMAVNGIDAASLAADLAKIGGGDIPDVPPGPNPPGPVPPGPTPVPPGPVPPAPVPQTFTVNIPQQAVKGSIFGGFYLPAITVTGSLTQDGAIPPSIVTLLCSAWEKYWTLTPRERDLASLMADGLRTDECTRAMNISRKTLHIHRYNMYRKLGVNAPNGVACIVHVVRMLALIGRTRIGGRFVMKDR